MPSSAYLLHTCSIIYIFISISDQGSPSSPEVAGGLLSLTGVQKPAPHSSETWQQLGIDGTLCADTQRMNR